VYTGHARFAESIGPSSVCSGSTLRRCPLHNLDLVTSSTKTRVDVRTTSHRNFSGSMCIHSRQILRTTIESGVAPSESCTKTYRRSLLRNAYSQLLGEITEENTSAETAYRNLPLPSSMFSVFAKLKELRTASASNGAHRSRDQLRRSACVPRFLGISFSNRLFLRSCRPRSNFTVIVFNDVILA
jgi:hypothetical protein